MPILTVVFQRKLVRRQS